MSVKSVLGTMVFAAGLIVGSLSSGLAIAADTTLKCTLYIAQSMDSVASDAVDLEQSSERLQTVRRAGYCVFEDGAVADKQFVMAIRALDGGKRGLRAELTLWLLAALLNQ